MAKQTPEQIAANWAQRLGSSTQKITDGVQAVTVAPGQSAARAKDLWSQKIMESKDKWAANTAAVTLGDWQAAMVNKGVQRIASGANASQGKFANFMGELLPHIDRVKGSLPARGDLEQNITRMTAFTRGMSQFRKGR